MTNDDGSRNRAILRSVLEDGFGKGKVDALDSLFAPDFQEHQFGMPPSLEGLKGEIRSLRSAFPDLQVTVQDISSDGDRVWVRATARGTHRGAFAGRPPSGKSFTMEIFDLCRFAGGKIVEHWGVPDRFALMRQIGALDRPGPR